MVDAGFEPAKALPADLQSAPVGRLGNPPKRNVKESNFHRFYPASFSKAVQRADICLHSIILFYTIYIFCQYGSNLVYIIPEVRIMKIKNQILKLRDLGYSYRQIEQKLNCSKGTIAYHCGEGQKDKTTNRRIVNRSKKHPLVRKIEYFNNKYNKPLLKSSKEIKTLNRILRLKIESFSIIEKGVYNNMSFTVQEFLDKVGDHPICSLTGRSIDLMKPASYQLDHIIPRSKGGLSNIDNCQLLCKAANQAKHDLSLEEFIQLCKEVVDYHKLREQDSNL